MTVRQRAARALWRIAIGAFLAWFIAVSVLATQAASTVARFSASDAPSLLVALRVAEAHGDAAALAADGGAEETPADDGTGDPMAPPGDDVPPEVEVDLEHDPWDVCSVPAIPPPSAVFIDFVAEIDRATGIHAESASPPPRA